MNHARNACYVAAWTHDIGGHKPLPRRLRRRGRRHVHQPGGHPADGQDIALLLLLGPRRDHGDAAQRDVLMALAAKAFAEDKVMIEAQQKVIDLTPSPRIMPTAHDRGVTLYNRLVERLVRTETDTARSAPAAS